MFTKDYVNTILLPFVGKNIRMKNVSDIPFCLETSMEATFQIRLNSFGISFALIDNFYIKRDIKVNLIHAFNAIDIPPFKLDTLLKTPIDNEDSDNVVFDKLVEYMQKTFTPQIAFTYYTMIKSLSVNEKGFVLNGTAFFISNH
jgi:hypothetical protein